MAVVVIRPSDWRILRQGCWQGWGVRPQLTKTAIRQWRQNGLFSREKLCGEYGIIIAVSIAMKEKSSIAGGTLLGVALALLFSHYPVPVAADVEVVPGVVGESDQLLMKDVVAAFDQADAAVRQADLETLMPFYAQGYNYYGLKRADVRRIWTEVFAHYRDMMSRHVFTEVKLIQTGKVKKASVACTGGLYGIDKDSGKRIAIDSWVNEIHYLVYEDGAWRFLGNKGGITESVPPSSAPHHPLF